MARITVSDWTAVHTGVTLGFTSLLAFLSSSLHDLNFQLACGYGKMLAVVSSHQYLLHSVVVARQLLLPPLKGIDKDMAIETTTSINPKLTECMCSFLSRHIDSIWSLRGATF
jgi:hypothetical protein